MSWRSWAGKERKPDKAILAWTNGMALRWMNLQQHLRGHHRDGDGERVKAFSLNPKNNDNKSVLNMAIGMKRYFLQKALRKPSVPPGETIDGYLFRGIFVTPGQLKGLSENGFWTDKAYMAFSTDVNVALSILAGKAATHSNEEESGPRSSDIPVLFIIKKSNIPTGTPWAWFGKRRQEWIGMTVALSQHLPKNKVQSLHGPASEVLLPPGKLRVMSVQRKEYKYGYRRISVCQAVCTLEKTYLNPN